MKKWNDLAKAVRAEPMILGNRVTGEALKEVFDKGLAIKKERDGEIIAFRGLWNTFSDNCLEMGSFWIRPDCRGLGLGSQIMKEIYSIFPKDKIIFVITRNPKVIHLLKRDGWNQVSATDWESVIPFEASCGPCDEFNEEQKKNCPYKAREDKCVLFYYKA